jgi:hypothetical protein
MQTATAGGGQVSANVKKTKTKASLQDILKELEKELSGSGQGGLKEGQKRAGTFFKNIVDTAKNTADDTSRETIFKNMGELLKELNKKGLIDDFAFNTKNGQISFFNGVPSSTSNIVKVSNIPEKEILELLRNVPSLKGVGSITGAVSSTPKINVNEKALEGIAKNNAQIEFSKLSLSERFNEAQKALGVSKVSSLNKVSTLQKSSQSLNQAVSNVEKSISKLKSSLASATTTMQKTSLRQAIRQLTLQQQQLKQRQRQRTKQKLTINQKRFRVRKTPKLPLFDSNSKTVKNLMLIGKQKRLVKILTGIPNQKRKTLGKPLPPFRALRKAQSYVDRNIQASFILKPTNKKFKGKDIPPIVIGKKFRPSKTNSLFIVEKRKYRLDSIGEKRQIQSAKVRIPIKRKVMPKIKISLIRTPPILKRKPKFKRK